MEVRTSPFKLAPAADVPAQRELRPPYEIGLRTTFYGYWVKFGGMVEATDCIPLLYAPILKGASEGPSANFLDLTRQRQSPCRRSGAQVR